MPHLVIDLTWNEHEALEALATKEEISVEELVRRAIDAYIATEAGHPPEKTDNLLTATHDHLMGPDEAMDLEL